MSGYADTEAQGLGAPITTRRLVSMKEAGEPIAILTAYDASFAYQAEQAGVEVVLVGDSLGMVIQGLETTVPVTMQDMIYHCKAAARGLDKALLLADMPFMSYFDVRTALLNAARLMQEGDARMVKLEGGVEQVETVSALAREGIPVCAHLGLKPQSIHKLGGYRVQGRDDAAAQQMLIEAKALAEAGADMLLLECVPEALAQRITHSVTIPVIGIGAGASCDGQVLVLQDVLGITPGGAPKFSQDFMAGAGSIAQALQHYVQAVKKREFPAAEHTFC